MDPGKFHNGERLPTALTGKEISNDIGIDLGGFPLLVVSFISPLVPPNWKDLE